jgi:hypothetical protein
MTTKTELLATYRAKMKATYPWAADDANLDRAMAAVKEMLDAGVSRNNGALWKDTLAEHGLRRATAAKMLAMLPE